jgi:undecaprenyl-diphosphatase
MELLYALHRLDTWLFSMLFRQGERGILRPCARALSRSGDGYLHLLVPLFLLLIGAPRLLDFVILLAASLLLERAIYWLLKNGFKRKRPQESLSGFRSLVVAADRFSFPSGHTSAAFLLATVLAIIYGGPILTLYAWASAIAFSRVILGVHYPGDTLAGALIGATIAMLMATQLGLL